MIRANKVDQAREGVVANPVTTIRRCRHGTMMYLRYDAYIGRSFDNYGEYSEGEVTLFRELLRAGDVALDIGANIGAFTIPMAQFVGPTGFVYAFEPQRIVFQILTGNVALNELGNVKTLQAAIGAVGGGTIRVPTLNYSALDNFGGLSVGGDEGEAVPVMAIDDLELPAVRMMKIDVEGMETAALKGAAATIARCRPLLYVENDRTEKSAELVRQVFDMGYRCWWHLTPLFNPDNFLRNPNNLLGRMTSFNMLCRPREMEAPASNQREIGSPDEAEAFLRQLDGQNAS